MNKNSHLQEQVVRVPFSLSAAYSLNKAPKGCLPDRAATSKTRVSSSANKCRKNKADSEIKRKNKFGRRAYTFTNADGEQWKLGPKISEKLKRKLSYGAKILQEGGIKKVFKRLFSVKEEERLLKALQCYLSTTAGPIAGLLFISTDKIAFCSERSIKIASPDGEMVRVHYKVLIPLSKIKRVDQSEDSEKALQRYIEIVTVDDFDFWFMGFLNHGKAFGYLQQAVSTDLR